MKLEYIASSYYPNPLLPMSTKRVLTPTQENSPQQDGDLSVSLLSAVMPTVELSSTLSKQSMGMFWKKTLFSFETVSL